MLRFKPHQFGRYFLAERIASGGMAEIFKAKSFGALGFEKELAIKRILPHLSQNSDFVNMLIDEAKINVQLNHMNIAQIYDLGKVSDNYFIAMEYIDGVDLRKIWCYLEDNDKRLSVGNAVFIVSEICKGLDYAHRKKDSSGRPIGIVHRDISPPNILISWEGEVKIVDFGIAKAAGNITETTVGVLKGKVPYMSPEQARGLDLDFRADIFSTGIILYELLTGKRLFPSSENSFKTLERIKKFEIEAPFLPGDAPSELEFIVQKALQNLPRNRYQSASEFHHDLMKFLYEFPEVFESIDLGEFLKREFSHEMKLQKKKAKRQKNINPEMVTENFKKSEEEILVTCIAQNFKPDPVDALESDPEPSMPLAMVKPEEPFNSPSYLNSDGVLEHPEGREPQEELGISKSKRQRSSVNQVFDWMIGAAYDAPSSDSFSNPAGQSVQRPKPLKPVLNKPASMPINQFLLPQNEGLFEFDTGAISVSPIERPILSAKPRRFLSKNISTQGPFEAVRRKGSRKISLPQVLLMGVGVFFAIHFMPRALDLGLKVFNLGLDIVKIWIL